MAPVIAVLGAGPHGRQVAALLEAELFDDDKPPLLGCAYGAHHHPYVIGAAFPNVRRQIASRLPDDAKPWEDGVVIFPGVRIGQGATVGKHTHLLYNVVVSHGCHVGEFVTVASGAVLCGEVTVGDDVFIGAGATIIHGGITVGDGATIGAGAVVLDDVPAGATVIGNPARMLEPSWATR